MNRPVLPGLALALAATLTAAVAGCSTGSEPQADAGPADVTFAQMMIPHHEQAVEMSDVVLAADGVDPEVAELAEQIKAAQQPEIDQLRSWLDEWDAPEQPHGGHDHGAMDGMMSQDDLTALADADGADASRLFLEQMIEHHEGAIAMAETEVSDGTHDGAVAMAEEIIATQQDEIDRMREMLASS
ncbi:DUF305 domain-containing protein [Isoptericola variabilis]|uniref:DUF305 domain-containing protein n=1 Tax=Isoptericola variabilis (strain 225) TaxID=743718 RepID=F6FXE3_ISOV2|nr:DUF305 domain-containing protein [Isoptericola variabilis]AEG44671.1 protein of unknown function DUF305 [Isoptericola variabilis 225]TWH33471.1 uncharacterized protein (DUF305 family) [Isoptericola variabilis J7]